MDSPRRNLKVKNSDLPGGPPAKRCWLLVEDEPKEVWRRNLKLKNNDAPGGPPPKRRRLLEGELGCYHIVVQAPPLSLCDLYVHEQELEEDVLEINIDDMTVRWLE
jgi:hypothetical protein